MVGLLAMAMVAIFFGLGAVHPPHKLISSAVNVLLIHYIYG